MSRPGPKDAGRRQAFEWCTRWAWALFPTIGSSELAHMVTFWMQNVTGATDGDH